MRALLLLLAGLFAAVPAAAQTRFLAQPDTLFYEGVNPFHMYAVRGTDTLGVPVRSHSVQRQVWRDSAGVLAVWQRGDDLGVPGRISRDSARFDWRGVALDPGGVYSGLMLPLRFPADGVLREGRVWQDTIDEARTMDDGSAYVYQMAHTLRVERITDTLGARMALVRGTGRLRYRQSAPPGPAGGPSWWMDASGPVDETFLIDLDHGRIASRAWWMDLRGISGMPNGAGGVDTLAAGLLSRDTTRLVTAERARLVSRDLPAGDTSITAAAEGPLLLHTVVRAGPSVESGLRRRDGSMLTVQARHQDGRAVRYALLQTSVHAEPVRRTVELRGGALHVSGGRDTVLALPAGAWAVSDYGVDEHLAGALARMAVEGQDEGTMEILRPLTLQWDRAQVRLLPVDEEVFLAVVRMEPDGIRDATFLLMFAKDGDLLYAEGMEPAVYGRRPRDGSARAKRLERLLGLVRGMDGKNP